jgi:hypothetical protein
MKSIGYWKCLFSAPPFVLLPIQAAKQAFFLHAKHRGFYSCQSLNNWLANLRCQFRYLL